jgi:aspartate aminotransferase-like enzyme
MEAAIANLLEPGEKIIVGVNGIWGERVADLSERYQGERKVLHQLERIAAAAAVVQAPGGARG